MLSTIDQQGAGYINSRERTYEGWAIVDVLGHQRYAGYVTTEYFGTTAFFRVLTPQRDPRDRVAEGHEWPTGWGTVEKGFTVSESGQPASERYIGAGSIYQLAPASKEHVLQTLDDLEPRTIVGVTDRDGKTVEKPRPDDDMPW